MGWVPRFRRYHEQLGLPALLSRLARFPSLGGTSRALCLRLSRAHERGSHGPGRCFGSRPTSLFARKALDLPGSWGTSACVPRSSTPVEPPRQVFLGASVLPSVIRTTSASTIRISRGSIPRPACSLSTLRSQGCPCATQDSLPAGDQPCRTGFYPPQDPSRRFQQCFISSLPPPPSFPGAP